MKVLEVLFRRPTRFGVLVGICLLTFTAVRVKAPVGYVQLQVPTRFSLIANPLNQGDNTVTAVLTNGVVEGMTLFKLNPTNLTFSANQFQGGAWSDPTMSLAPGEGAFLFNPGAPATLTFVGELLGNVSYTNSLPAGLSLVSSMLPEGGRLDTTLGFPVADGDVIYRYNNALSAYEVYTYDFGSWTVPPVVNLAESFFVWKAAATNWVQTYSF
ncbi:MAG: hypothetical protein KGS61_17150 [Verrucomicrobia bacterium]|nr:hypothetical protein [Verrucomicrobiota bacterium]